MTSQSPPIYFYLPQADWPVGNMLESVNSYREVYKNCRSDGTLNWILQTYLRLKEDGFPCELVGSMPTEGIVVAGLSSVPSDLRPGSKLLIVVPYGDKTPHPYAQVHIVQNSREILKPYRLLGDRYLSPGEKYYIPHWPQPALIPRNPDRGDRFETIAFFGREVNIVPEFKHPQWHEQLGHLGLQWRLISNVEYWNDYSEVDAVLAVRSFNKQGDYYWKPASKLYNAWHAGVPAILGCESAYQAERKSDLDYIEVASLDATLSALKQLRDDPELRRAIVANGRMRAAETQPEKLIARWRTFFADVAVPAYERWCNGSEWTRETFLMRRQLAIETQEMRKNLQQVRNRLKLRSRLQSLRTKLRRA